MYCDVYEGGFYLAGGVMNKVVKEVAFDAAHRLFGYPGKCANIHGHRYRVLVALNYREVRDDGLSIDFSRISDSVGKWISENWDHKLLLNSEDPLGKYLVDTSLCTVSSIFSFEKNPTAEVLAEYLVKVVIPYQWPYLGHILHSISVYETPTCCAVVKVPHVSD
jgi:6-pyruvoyltetrahydropterin/6-carboxytetrahydropterin synthase